MNIQSGRNPVRRATPAPVQGSSLMSKLQPALLGILMIVMVAGVFEMHVFLKSGISSMSNEINDTKQAISHTQKEIQNLRNKIEERNRWSYVRMQIQRFGIKLRTPAHGQMHWVTMLPDETVRRVAAAMEKRELRRAAMNNVPSGKSIYRNTRVRTR